MKWFSVNIKELKENLSKRKLFSIPLDDFLLKGVLFLVLVIFIVWMLPSERPFEYSNLTIGSVSGEEIIAPFTFPIVKSPEQLERERQEAQLRVPPVFMYDANVANVQQIKLKNLFNELIQYFNRVSHRAKVDTVSLPVLLTHTNVDSVLQQVQVKYGVQLQISAIQNLYHLYQENRMRYLQNRLLSIYAQIFNTGIIDQAKNNIQESKIAVVKNGLEEELGVHEVLDRNQALEVMVEKLSEIYTPNQAEYEIARQIIPAFLVPNLQFNSEVTRTRKEKAVHEVPPTKGFVYKNQRIVDSHEIITEDVYLTLQSMAQALNERSMMKRGWNRVLFFGGKYLFAALVVLILGFLIYYFRPNYFSDNKLLLLIALILLIQFLFTILVTDVLGWSYLSIPIILGPMLLSMLLDSLTAFLGTIVISFILGASQGNNYYLALLVLVVGTVALFSVQKIRNRGQMFRAIFYIILGYGVINFAYGFIHYESVQTVMKNFVFYQVPNAILAPTAVFLLIGVFERFFDVTTDITLLELSDLNHPLLKRLSVEAPGTFHHSIIVGNLAEAAAKAIGANSLLARVGCYYHDIGKMLKAEYFVENQTGAINKHENLTPTMSCLVLAKHVKAGLELAEQHRLPKAVKQFIPEHHGTSLMAYFYQKAKDTMDEKDINENDFRYPGPKPQSRETAIAMLADSVEAAARTLPNPNPQRIRALVENLVEKRFQEGELDECDLTLRGLNKIKEAFIPILLGIHHLRIEYPAEATGEKPKKPAVPKEPVAKKTDTREKPVEKMSTEASLSEEKKKTVAEMNGGDAGAQTES
ncbi:MAG: HDIG domain-containing protein [Calditrichia bacterium]